MTAVTLPTLAGVPVAITSPGSSVNASQVGDLLEAVEHHLARVPVLALFVVDEHPHAEVVGVTELVRGDDPRTERPVGVERLAMVIVGVRSCQSRTETSLAIV